MIASIVPPTLVAQAKLPTTITTRQLGEHLGISVETVRRWSKVGLLPPPLVRAPKHWLFSTAQVLAHLEARQTGQSVA